MHQGDGFLWSITQCKFDSLRESVGVTGAYHSDSSVCDEGKAQICALREAFSGLKAVCDEGKAQKYALGEKFSGLEGICDGMKGAEICAR